MKKWWTLYLAQRWDRQLLWAAAVVALVPIAYTSLASSKASPAGEAPVAVDTYIPKGFVLVPIEADNYESLDSILGQYGYVDLFQAGTEGGERRAVARNVRLMRAPLNPSSLAVLIPERESSRLLRSGGVFTVVVRRPGRSGTEFVNSSPEPRHAVARKITYGE